MTELRDDPLSAFYNGIPTPAFTLLRCYMLEDSELDTNLLTYLTEYWSELLPVCQEISVDNSC